MQGASVVLSNTNGQQALAYTNAQGKAYLEFASNPVSYTHLRAHETPEHLVCRLLLEKKKEKQRSISNDIIKER